MIIALVFNVTAFVVDLLALLRVVQAHHAHVTGIPSVLFACKIRCVYDTVAAA